MPESPAAESAVNPYVSPQEDEANAGKLEVDVAFQVYGDIREEAKRLGLEVKPEDSPGERDQKDQALRQLFENRSTSDLPDYQAAQIVDSEEKATRDSLTGLLNRRGFETEFAKFLEDAKRFETPILFLILDLDYFKKINDTYGHNIGDQALQYLTRALTQSVEIGDLVARWGGEEFVIAVKPKTGDLHLNPDKLLIIAERIRNQTVDLLSKDRYELMINGVNNESSIPITLSVGATLTKPDDTLETICQRADENLYKAKNSGRNQSFGDDGKIELPS